MLGKITAASKFESYANSIKYNSRCTIHHSSATYRLFRLLIKNFVNDLCRKKDEQAEEHSGGNCAFEDYDGMHMQVRNKHPFDERVIPSFSRIMKLMKLWTLLPMKVETPKSAPTSLKRILKEMAQYGRTTI